MDQTPQNPPQAEAPMSPAKETKKSGAGITLQSRDILLIILSVLLLVILGALMAYYLGTRAQKELNRNQKTENTVDQNKSDQEDQETEDESEDESEEEEESGAELMVPAGWSVVTSQYCNLSMVQPPKAEPYYYEVGSGKDPVEADEGSVWTFSESTDLESPLRGFDRRASMLKRTVLGGDYMPGWVSVYCRENSENYTTDSFATAFIAEQNATSVKVGSSEQTTMWDRPVYAVTYDGGLINPTKVHYIFATPTHLYEISTQIDSENPVVKESTEYILNNIVFGDEVKIVTTDTMSAQ